MSCPLAAVTGRLGSVRRLPLFAVSPTGYSEFLQVWLGGPQVSRCSQSRKRKPPAS